MKTRKQYEIAKWLGIAPSTLSNIFNDNRRPGRKLAVRLAEKSGVAFSDWLLADPNSLRKKVFIAWTISTEGKS